MATFEAQVEGLTGIAIESSGTAPTQAELTQFLTDGAKEILNTLPRSKQSLFTTANDLNGSSQSLTLLGSEVFSVTRDDGTINQPCRKVPAELNGRIRDADDMMAATVTDPAYYVTNNILVVVPSPTNDQNAHVHTLNYPTVAFGDSTIAKFPDDAEYLVPIYGAIKSLQNSLGALSLSNTDVTDALTAIGNALTDAKNAVDKFENADSESVFADESTFLTNDSQLTRVKDALDAAENVVNNNQPSADTDAFGAQANEDIELVTSALNISSAEIRRAQTHLAEWNAIGDMRVKEVNAALAEARGHAEEIQARLSVDLSRYSKYEKQQAKLQADYDKGIQALK
jgi:NACalpha-BTF3-like transcription factor